MNVQYFLLYFFDRKEIINMGTFFWDFGDFNDIERQWAMFIVNIIAFVFTFYSLIRTAKYHGKVLFELLPLSINTIATLILLFIKLFEKGYEFDLVGYSIQIFTYFLFCYTFSVMHSKLIATHRSFNFTRLCNILFAVFAVMVVVLIILIMSSVIAKNCDNDLKEASIVGFVTQFVSYIPTLYFGMDIFKNMTKKHEEEKAESSKELFLFAPVSDQYIRQRKKQIKLVLGAYSVSLILRAFILIFNLSLPDYFDCTECDGVKIITSDETMGQIILVIVQINQLIPHLIIPIALYVIPVKVARKSADLSLQETLILDDEDEEDHHAHQAIQRQISTSILKRSISPSKISSDYDSETDV